MIDEFRSEEIGSGFAVQRLSRGEHRLDDEWVSIGRWDEVNKCVVYGRDTAKAIAAALNPPVSIMVPAGGELPDNISDAIGSVITYSNPTSAVAQAFFEQLAAEAAKPHHGNRSITHALLIRAQEAGLYTPAKEQL